MITIPFKAEEEKRKPVLLDQPLDLFKPIGARFFFSL